MFDGNLILLLIHCRICRSHSSAIDVARRALVYGVPSIATSLYV
jgi:hypothetical protein